MFQISKTVSFWNGFISRFQIHDILGGHDSLKKMPANFEIIREDLEKKQHVKTCKDHPQLIISHTFF